MIVGPKYFLPHRLSLIGTVQDIRRSAHCEGELYQESRTLYFDPTSAKNGMADDYLQDHLQVKFIIIYWEQVIHLLCRPDTCPTLWCNGAIPFFAKSMRQWKEHKIQTQKISVCFSSIVWASSVIRAIYLRVSKSLKNEDIELYSFYLTKVYLDVHLQLSVVGRIPGFLPNDPGACIVPSL